MLVVLEEILLVVLLIDEVLTFDAVEKSETKVQDKVVVTVAWMKLVTVELFAKMVVTVFGGAATLFTSVVAVIVSLMVVVEREAEQRTSVELCNIELLQLHEDEVEAT